MKITGTCKSKIAAAALSSMLVLGMASPALAATTGKIGYSDVPDATQKITGLQSGDTVKAWLIADAYINDATNEVEYGMADGLPEEYNTIEGIRAIGEDNGKAKTAADAILAAFTAPGASVSEEQPTAQANESGEATLTLNSGYYLITVTTTSGSTVLYQNILVDASPNGDGSNYSTRTLDDVAVKSSEVTNPDKKVIDGDNAAETTDGASVGDTVKFQIAGTIPSYPSNATHATYKVTDTPASGLEINTASIVVKSRDKTLEAGDDKDSKDYTVAQNKDGGFTITFSNPLTLSGQAYTIEYSAKVTAVGEKDGTVANNAHATFNPNPYEEGTVDTGNDHATVQTYGFVFKKVGGDNHQPLAGAEFQVKDASGNLLTKDGAAITLTSDANGYVSLAGLKAGTYTLTETKVPAGYQKVNDFDIELSSTTVTGDNPATTDTEETNYNYYNGDNGVKDAKQGPLPTTGGAGTVALTAAGVVLIAGAAGFIVMSRRRNDSER